MAKAKTATGRDIELNRWCIEMAMAWPTVHVEATHATYGNQIGAYPTAVSSAFQQALPVRNIDADVIGRAGKIMAWVKATH